VNSSTSVAAFPVDDEEVAFNADVESPGVAGPPAPAPSPAPTPIPAPVPVPVPTCKVPDLTGKKLKAARKVLKTAVCKLGTVTRKEGATAGDGRIRRQSPKAWKIIAAGSKVKVTLKP
jgi:hypothetical protein